MANDQKLTTLGQMRTLAQQQDTRDDAQDALIQQLDEENEGFLKHTENITTEEINEILAT